MRQGFPHDIHYLNDLEWTASARQYQINNQHKFKDIPVYDDLKSQLEFLEVQRCPENHPSSGYGLYTTINLEPNAFILDYNGIVDLDDNIPSQNDYCIHLHEKLCVEAETKGNEARFINDYFNVASRPNVAFDTYVNYKGNLAVGVWVLNLPIEKDQELLVTYGHSFWKSRGIPRQGPEWDDGWDS
ncbi:hypothetical protein HDV06_002699 [Boothiomyces sp. JEL0866]|nr:hypothetical protein HDV06_002699 [Boothiomyces sp. JEL0866]